MSEFNKPTNPPAFPNAHYHNVSGMTLRDYFAAKAMQAIISSHDNTTLDFVSGKAYQYADAMLKARES
jgi:hypothetical protein